VVGVTSGVEPGYLSLIVDAVGDRPNGPWGINRRVDTAAVEEAVLGGNRTVGGVLVIPDNVSLVVDAEGLSIEGPGKIENGIGAVAVDETLVLAPANPIRLVKPDDVSLVVDVKGIGDETAGGIDCRV
jgi:hypothetical protein